MFYIDIFLTAFFVSLITIPIIKKLSLRAGYIDVPNERKIHSNPVSRLGGMGIYLGFILSFFLVAKLHGLVIDKTISGILIGATLITIIGVIDDLRGMPAIIKLMGQVITALITAVVFGIQIEFVSNPLDGGLIYLGAFSVLITVLWIIGIINALNLIDGLDGLAGGVTVIAATSLFAGALINGEINSALITIALIGATLGFLKYNYNPASIFMGDTGSMLLGYILASISVIGVLKSTTTVALAVPILALGIPIYDTISSILRRIKNKKHIFKADGEHIHHRLLDLGFTHKQVVKMIYFASILLSICSLIMTILSGWMSLLVLIIICMIIGFGIQRIHKHA